VNHGRPDLLPDEPGGYTGYSGLFGAKYVDPVIHPNGPMTDLDGNVIQDATGHVGFPGFDGMEATVSLSWVAQMQEAGIPITYAYVSDAHDGHGTAGNIHFAYGPGEAGYVQQLHDYDMAFAKFFDRLAAVMVSTLPAPTIVSARSTLISGAWSTRNSATRPCSRYTRTTRRRYTSMAQRASLFGIKPIPLSAISSGKWRDSTG
jgi:hypothetical protein